MRTTGFTPRSADLRTATPVLVLAAVFIISANSACSTGAAVRKAERAVQEFHDNYNARNFRRIFLEAHELYRGNAGSGQLG